MASRSRWLIAVSAIAALLFGPGLAHQSWWGLRQWRLEHRLHALQVRHGRLLAEQERLQSNPTYVEGLIRTTFKVARPGEYVVPLDESASSRRR